MELSDIKRGDILVAYYPDVHVTAYGRNYIIFIASGHITPRNIGQSKIETLAHINLAGEFQSIHDVNKYPSIGFTELAKDPRNISIIRKPTLNEVMELISKMKNNNLKFNRKTKKIIENYD